MRNAVTRMPGKYFLRRRFYVPIKEQTKYYGRQADKNHNNYLVTGDFLEDDPVLPGEHDGD